MSSKLVSIVLPTFDRAHLIGETIRSVLSQTHENWELIVVDDGSSDLTELLISTYKDARIIFTKLPHSGKLGIIRNQGIRLSKGSVISFIDSDDIWEDHKLETQLRLLDEYSDAGFAFSNFTEFGDGAVIPHPREALFVGNVFKEMLLNGKFGVCMPSLIFRREVLSVIGMMNDQFASGADIDFFFRMAYQFDAVYSDERLVRVRKHEQSASNRFGDIVYEEQISMLRDFLKTECISTVEFNLLASRLFYRMGLLQLKASRRIDARSSYSQAISLRPWFWQGWLRWSQTFLPK